MHALGRKEFAILDLQILFKSVVYFDFIVTPAMGASSSLAFCVCVVLLYKLFDLGKVVT